MDKPAPDVGGEPESECPDWCTMHVQGRHVAELALAKTVNGFNIYTRPTDHGNGGQGLELVVAAADGTTVKKVQFTPQELELHDMQMDLLLSLVAFENGTPIEDDPPKK